MATNGWSDYQRARTEFDEAWQAHNEFIGRFVFYWNRIEAGQAPGPGDISTAVLKIEFDRVASQMSAAHERFYRVTGHLFDSIEAKSRS